MILELIDVSRAPLSPSHNATLDSARAVQDNLGVLRPEASRKRIARTLSAAFADGLLSDETFAERLDQLLKARLVRPKWLIGDLALRRSDRSIGARARDGITAMVGLMAAALGRRPTEESTLLALDWSGAEHELLVGRHQSCDVVLSDPAVSREHARLIFRGSNWIVQDLKSTNGTFLNGARVGRSELRPGDRLMLGHEVLRVD